jgi:DNA primase
MTLDELLYSQTEVHDGNKEGEHWIQCPFCQDEKYRFGINVDTGQAHCFRGSCEWKTSDKSYLFRELCKIWNVNDHKLVVTVKKRKAPRDIVHITTQLPNEYESFAQTDEIGKEALAYLVKRGVTLEQIKKHKIGFCAYGKYAYRIVFPIKLKGKIVGFTCRDFTDQSSIKYLNSDNMKGLFNAPTNNKKVCVLSEGPLDALAIERACPNVDSIARLGSGFTTFQKKILKCYNEIILWPDPDKAGVDLAIKTARALQQITKVSCIMFTADDVDPGKLGETKEGLESIVKRIAEKREWDANTKLRLLARL